MIGLIVFISSITQTMDAVVRKILDNERRTSEQRRSEIFQVARLAKHLSEDGRIRKPDKDVMDVIKIA